MSTPRFLFICLGNICRSPSAEGIMRHLAHARGIEVEVDSAGTSDWHIGNPPHGPMQSAAGAAGYDLSSLKARQFTAEDFDQFDVIFAMDENNLAKIEDLRPSGHPTPARLYRTHDPEGGTNVPDPYYTGEYSEVVRLIERTSSALLDDLTAR